jgi:hypothetical protein
VLLDSLQLPPMGLRLGRLLGLQLCKLGLQYYTRKVRHMCKTSER